MFPNRTGLVQAEVLHRTFRLVLIPCPKQGKFSTLHMSFLLVPVALPKESTCNVGASASPEGRKADNVRCVAKISNQR